MKQILIQKKNAWLFVAVVFYFTSCVDGYKDDWTFSTGVENVQLESPVAESFTFTKNAEGTILTINWSVVYGALGYQFSLYDVTDVNNPVTIVENEIVDGCSKKVNIIEDTNYKVVVKALGNPKLNNKDAVTATEVPYSTMIPAIILPDGTDLYAFFQANPIPESADEQAYELEAGGNYTLSGAVDFSKNWITLRGNRTNYPTLKYTIDGRIAISNGFKLKFINVDCSEVVASTGVINLSSTPDESIMTGGYYTLPNPVVIQSCTFKGVNSSFLYDSGRAYCVPNFLIKDCIVSFPSTAIFFRLTNNSYINSLTVQNSTIYGIPNSNGYFAQYKNNARGTGTTVNFSNSTFYNIAVTGQMANYSGLNNSGCKLILIQNIFVNCSNKDVVRRLSAGGTNMQRDLKDNCYWYDTNSDGVADFEAGNEMGHSYGDKSGTGFYENPAFAGNVQNPNPESVNFMPAASASAILSKRCGDPRWLPVQ
jgi:hypothetical protein